MKVTEVKKVYDDMLKNGEIECSLEFGKFKIFEFTKLSRMETKRYLLFKNNNISDPLKALLIWKIDEGNIKKIPLDFFSFNEKKYEDSLFKTKTRNLENFFKYTSDPSTVYEFLYFCFPLFEKFHKIYVLNFVKSKRINDEVYSVLDYLSYFFDILTDKKIINNYEEVKINLLSNKKLKELGFGKRKNIFLENLIREIEDTGHYWRFNKYFIFFHPSILKEIDEAEKRGVDIFSYFSPNTPSEKVEVYSHNNYKVFNGCSKGSSIYEDQIIFNDDRHGLYEISKLQEKAFQLIDLAYNYKMPISTIFKYLKTVYDEQYLSKLEGISLYIDYLNMSFKLFDSYEKYPKRLKTMHDKVVDIFNKSNIQFDDATDVKIKERYLKLSFLEGELDDEHLIVLPKKSKDITSEGKALAHCVGAYVSKVADNDTAILFIRNKKNIKKPLYTAEIKNGRIVQLKGLANSEVPIIIWDELKNKLKNINKLKKGA